MSLWIVQTVVSSSLLVVIVLMLRGPVSRHFGARIGYALWLLPPLRMALPPLPGWHQLYVPAIIIAGHQSAVGLMPPQTVIDAASHARFTAPHLAEATSAPAGSLMHDMGLPLTHILLAIWLGGAALWFGWQMLAYARFLHHALRGATLLTRECGIDVLISDGVSGPVAAGIAHRRIFLPADFMARYSPQERRLALLHEGAHHDRRDILANLVATILLALHWWNPLAHRAYRAFRDDQELACDAMVLAGAAPADRHAYGSAVLKSASGRMPAVACALSHKSRLKQRILMMKPGPSGIGRLLLGVTIAIAAIGGGLLITASGEANIGSLDQAREDARIAQMDADRAVADARIAETQARAAAAEARRNGDESAKEAHAAARRARMASERARAAGRALAAREMAIGHAQIAIARHGEDEAQKAIAAARGHLAAKCASEGYNISVNADWATLATCGPALQDQMRAAMMQAHLSAERGREQAERERERAQQQADRIVAEANRAAARMSQN